MLDSNENSLRSVNLEKYVRVSSHGLPVIGGDVVASDCSWRGIPTVSYRARHFFCSPEFEVTFRGETR